MSKAKSTSKRTSVKVAPKAITAPVLPNKRAQAIALVAMARLPGSTFTVQAVPALLYALGTITKRTFGDGNIAQHLNECAGYSRYAIGGGSCRSDALAAGKVWANGLKVDKAMVATATSAYSDAKAKAKADKLAAKLASK